MVAAIVLAAGASLRMGRSKVLLPLERGTVLSTVVGRVLRARVGRLVLVLGHDAGRVRREASLPKDPRIRIVVNEDWAQGMASSLRKGIEESLDAGAVVIALGDQPGVDPGVIDRLVDAWHQGAPLAVPVHHGRLGHPVLFDRRLYGSLLGLAGDVGAREIVKAHWAEAAQVEGAPLGDLDTPADYEDYLAGLPPGKPGGPQVP